MSFLFDWVSLHSMDIKHQINSLLYTLTIPQFPDKVSLTQLQWGAQAPRFELVDIVELAPERFKGLFKFRYSGQLQAVLRSNIEINALRLIDFDGFTKPHYVSADSSTVLPVDFTIAHVSVDFLFSVVSRGDKVTVVFNDEPLIDLQIKTTIDELLDDDMMAALKGDALQMITEYLKQDLPELIARSQDNLIPSSIPQSTHQTSMDDVEDMEGMDMDMSIHLTRMDTNVYNTLSLKPRGFDDVVQRISLSQERYKRDVKHDTSTKIRRRIKMNRRRATQTGTTTTTTTTASTAASLPMTPKMVAETPLSHLSSPTLMDSPDASTASIEDFLNQETLVLNDSFSHADPYEHLTHPMDILDEDDDHSIIMEMQQKMRPRAFSSNYMNLG